MVEALLDSDRVAGALERISESSTACHPTSDPSIRLGMTVVCEHARLTHRRHPERRPQPEPRDRSFEAVNGQPNRSLF
jgi:hypothetical protein